MPKRLRGWLCGLLLVAAAPAPVPWSKVAVQDLIAMHDLIRDNHPGAVDPRNPGFHDWLDGGEAALLPKARAARTRHDYQLVLRDYANGFADGHLGVVMNDPGAQRWPGFLVRADRPGAPLRVSVLDAPDRPGDVQVGDVVQSCGGISAAALLQQRVLRPLLNPHVPQRLPLASAALMVSDADDPAGQWPSCMISSAGAVHGVRLHWRGIAPSVLAQEKIRSSGIEVPPVGLRQIDGVWLISMPNFEPQNAAATAQWQTLLAHVKAQAARLHGARRVVLDLRGNDGGDDAWGFDVAEALWGSAAVEAVEAAMPSVIDWRVSIRNAAALHHDTAILRQQGQSDGAAYFGALADRMDRAVRAKDIFMREPGDPPRPVPRLTSPFVHPVYLLTTPHCASACLDFVDLMNALPGVVRVGMETSSDTDYLEVATAVLPSGHATLRYPMKVYRQRQRGANVSEAPSLAWPGGDMNDTTLTRWIKTLP